jgi:hypothetical protein
MMVKAFFLLMLKADYHKQAANEGIIYDKECVAVKKGGRVWHGNMKKRESERDRKREKKKGTLKSNYNNNNEQFIIFLKTQTFVRLLR